jgi:uncharacterized protein
MLIRFSLSNLFSFEETKEFNMLPSPKYKRLDSHKYSINNFDVLKMSSLYGANGAGKSNLIKSLSLLKNIVLKEELPLRLKDSKFKFRDKEDNTPQILAIEFFQNNVAYYYALEIANNTIKTEELYQSGLGRDKDKLIFERKTDEKEKTHLTFLNAFENDKESQLLKRIIEKNLAKPNKPLLQLLTTLNNPFLDAVNDAFKWFEETLEIIYPDLKPSALVHRIDLDSDFKHYANDIMSSFNIGVNSLKSEKKSLKDFFGEDKGSEFEELTRKVEESPNKMLVLKARQGDEIVLVSENDAIFVKQLKLEHTGKDNKMAVFNLDEESDGTIRLLDFIPAFKDLITKRKVIVVDEIERSIHPLLIKELIKKFSFDDNTQGQFIFTTHESNLLDQTIFRQDEIWFAEKNKQGSTELYSLSDFKEHNTIDIRKGYLNGRYGSIPFLANLQDLNWHKYDTQK